MATATTPSYYFGEGGTMMIDGKIEGQQATALYDALRQAAYKPDLRMGRDGMASITMPYADLGFEGFFSQLQMMVTGSASRQVAASEFFWAEYTSLESLAFALSGDSASAATTKTRPLSRFAQTKNGLFAKPLAGYQAIIKGLGGPAGQLVNITAVTQVAAGNWTVTIAGINGQTINLSGKDQYTLTIIPMQNYVLGTDTDIAKHGIVYNPPLLWKSWVQKYEDGIPLDESEIDNYVYNRKWEVVKGVNSNGEPVDYIYIPALDKKLRDRIAANRTLRLLFNRRDSVNNQNFNGLIPTVQNYGMFNFAYDDLMQGSFRAILFSIIKSLRRINGSPENFLLHDFHFGLDWSNAIADLVKAFEQNYKFSLFGDGGMGGDRDFTYFNFRDFGYQNYKFRSSQVDVFDTYRYGGLLESFALLMPAKKLQDTQGDTVPIVTMVHIAGAEPAKENKIWFDDARVRGKRTIDAYAKDNLGFEFHAPMQCGMIYKNV